MNYTNREKVRFKFIEAMILEYGVIKRYHIERCFDIAVAAAGRTIKSYNNASGNLINRGKPHADFNPKFLDIEPAKFLEAAEIMAIEPIIQHKTILS